MSNRIRYMPTEPKQTAIAASLHRAFMSSEFPPTWTTIFYYAKVLAERANPDLTRTTLQTKDGISVEMPMERALDLVLRAYATGRGLPFVVQESEADDLLSQALQDIQAASQKLEASLVHRLPKAKTISMLLKTVEYRMARRFGYELVRRRQLPARTCGIGREGRPETRDGAQGRENLVLELIDSLGLDARWGEESRGPKGIPAGSLGRGQDVRRSPESLRPRLPDSSAIRERIRESVLPRAR